jgi:formylglycine-generating enzyme required for sulfatase activity
MKIKSLALLGATSVLLCSCGGFSNYEEKINDNMSFNMIAVEGGTFDMGATPDQGDAGYDEKPVHSVTLSNYYIAEMEVTQALWKEIMGTDAPNYNKGDSLAVGKIKWDEAVEFCKKLSEKTGKTYRLPTEAEWEYAARGGKLSQKTKYAGSNNIDEVAWVEDNADKPQNVGTKKANELGLYDMSGGAEEWCSDWKGDYKEEAQTDPQGAEKGTVRIVRGGSWNQETNYARVAYRQFGNPTVGSEENGFRVVCEVQK